MRDKSIGVFDSGIGGLTILRGLVKLLPQYNYVYLGDTAHTPYGPRSADEVYAFTKESVDFLFSRGCQVIILACNTASSQALRRIQQEHLPTLNDSEKRILGVLIPSAQDAVTHTKNGRIGVLATEGTVGSGAFTAELKKVRPSVRVFEQACPQLVPMIEAGLRDRNELQNALKGYLESLMRETIDTLILGCTHYAILEDQIRHIVGADVRIASQTHVIAESFRRYLERHPSIEQRVGVERKRFYYTTGSTTSISIRQNGVFKGS